MAPRHGPAERPRRPDSQGPPLRGEHAVRRVLPVSQPHAPGQDQFRRVLTEALAPGRLAAYARVVLTDECQARLRMAEGSDLLSRWMRLSCLRPRKTSADSSRPGSPGLALSHRTSLASRIVSCRSWLGRSIAPYLSCSCSPTSRRQYRTWCGPVDHCTAASRSWPRFPTCLPGGTCLTTSKPDVAAPPGCGGWL